MLVGERMSHPVIALTPETSIHDALHLLRSEHIRRAPVIADGELVGIVSLKDLLNASPSAATSLSVWELNYLLSKLTVATVMSRQVYAVTEDTPLEEAARLMADKRIGGLPVLRGHDVVGIITETDLFKLFLELMGAREAGVRLTCSVENTPGQLARLATALAEAGGNIVALGTFSGEDSAHRELMIKLTGLAKGQVRELVERYGATVIDLRMTTV